ncbi:hypothetical protein OCAE111667_04335 [Occultella aeris]|uniref:Lipoprotein n=1 Tax=Occultella aeris TaxID=2761496 RepID=A0A7M4DG47_9MICO|nr:hypothetical protein [Occultella aeris]VZO35890.1 hypothetical protein HALOF300_01092 [Occultella aeris]
MDALRRLPVAVAAAILALTTAACAGPAGPPDRDPDVTGKVGTEGTTLVLVGPSDPYYEGMSLLRGDPDFLRGDQPIEAADLVDSEDVEVWVEGGCAESYPVQCEVVAVRAIGE